MWNKQFYGSTTLGERGQIVIPAEARDLLKLEKGEKLLVFGFKNDTIMLTKLSSFRKMSEELSRRHKEINKIIKEN